MRDRINASVKMREWFRPFAPSVLESELSNHFELDHPAAFMLETCQVRSTLELPAVTHVDGTARVHTVNSATNARFAGLLQEFFRRTGCPILLNTSFNMRGEPMTLTVTLRLPGCGPSGDSVRMAVNEHHVAAIDAERSWKTVQVDLPAGVIRDGVNSVNVSWPMPVDAPLGIERAARRLAQGENDALFSVFGELHCLTVRAASIRHDAMEMARNASRDATAVGTVAS